MSQGISKAADWLSGLAHQLHFRGHPLKNTTVRMPGPSLRLNFCMLKTVPSWQVFSILITPCHGLAYRRCFLDDTIQEKGCK